MKLIHPKIKPLKWTLVLLLLTGCVSSPPTDITNVCKIFSDKGGWYTSAMEAEKRWKSPVPVAMAIMYQESAFRARAKPPRKYILGVIPGPRPSNAVGYAQALESTWSDYERATGRKGKRTNFQDSIDFIGWYNDRTFRQNGVHKTDAYNLYLAYHEGPSGYANKTYNQKAWLLRAAKRVADNAERFDKQLISCRAELGRSWWRRFF
jgi:hypothetical protein